MRSSIDLSGKRIGLLVPVRPGDKIGIHRTWICRCDCGNLKTVKASDLSHRLRAGGSASCGCATNRLKAAGASLPRKHGATSRRGFTRTYRAWQGMRARCRSTNPKRASYYDRGIVVCERWSSFENFLADMGERPEVAHTLDRIDNDRGYEPGNCRWATWVTQARNRSSTRLDEVAALQIRWLRTDGGFSTRAVASAFGVTTSTIAEVTSGRTWNSSSRVRSSRLSLDLPAVP